MKNSEARQILIDHYVFRSSNDVCKRSYFEVNKAIDAAIVAFFASRDYWKGATDFQKRTFMLLVAEALES